MRFRGVLLTAVAVSLAVLLFTVPPRDVARTVGLIVLVTLPLAWSVFALLDAARRPEWVWALAGRARVLWMVAILAGTLALPVGVAISTWYLLGIRRELRDAEDGRLRDR